MLEILHTVFGWFEISKFSLGNNDTSHRTHDGESVQRNYWKDYTLGEKRRYVAVYSIDVSREWWSGGGGGGHQLRVFRSNRE